MISFFPSFTRRPWCTTLPPSSCTSSARRRCRCKRSSRRSTCRSAGSGRRPGWCAGCRRSRGLKSHRRKGTMQCQTAGKTHCLLPPSGGFPALFCRLRWEGNRLRWEGNKICLDYSQSKEALTDLYLQALIRSLSDRGRRWVVLRLFLGISDVKELLAHFGISPSKGLQQQKQQNCGGNQHLHLKMLSEKIAYYNVFFF